MPYPEELVAPMRQELVAAGVLELKDAAAVDEFMSDETGTALIVVNSVCGCAAGSARPGLRLALENSPKPDRVATVFAGQDLEAVQQARDYFDDVPPSSPSMALFKDGKLVHFLPRHMIEGRSPDEVAKSLAEAFRENC